MNDYPVPKSAAYIWISGSNLMVAVPGKGTTPIPIKHLNAGGVTLLLETLAKCREALPPITTLRPDWSAAPPVRRFNKRGKEELRLEDLGL